MGTIRREMRRGVRRDTIDHLLARLPTNPAHCMFPGPSAVARLPKAPGRLSDSNYSVCAPLDEATRHKDKHTKTMAGLGIDHWKAVIMVATDKAEETVVITSQVDKQLGRLACIRSTAPGKSLLVPSDDRREREFRKRLSVHCNGVIACIIGAEAILLFGLGEAKVELKRLIERDNLGGRIVGIETVDKMTDRQIAAEVRRYFVETGT